MAGFLAASAAEAGFVTLFGDLVDAWEGAAVRSPWWIPGLMLVAAVVRGCGELMGEVLLARISHAVVHRLRCALFEQLLTLPSSFFDASARSHLVSRITFNVVQLRDTGTDALKSLVQDGGKVIVYLSVMLYLSWALTLIFLVMAPLVAVVVLQASRRFRRISRRIQRSMGAVTHVASEAAAGYREVKLYGGEADERRRFADASRANQRQNLKLVATKVGSTQLVQVFVALALAVLIALLFQPALGGALSSGDVVTFLGLAGMLARPVRKLTELNARLQRGLAAAEDIFSQLDQPSEADDGELAPSRVAGRLEFRAVHFAYPGGTAQALNGIDLVIEAGETVALVGPSGGGKSTLISLVARFYEPTAGDMLLDGVPLRRYRLSALRRQIALVPQQVTLFNDTLAANVAYGDLADASPAAVQRALRLARVSDFLDDLPAGLDTRLGDDGLRLSGGQRQRVALARALLKDAPLVILDEATSALDTASEQAVQTALAEVIRDRTAIIVAHRLSTARLADRILVLDGGRIVEAGSHDALLERDGLYRRLFEASQRGAASLTAQPAGPAVAAGEAGDDTAGGGAGRVLVRRDDVPARLHRWYVEDEGWPGEDWLDRVSRPLARLFGWAAERRRLRLSGRAGRGRSGDVPVIVVGNISVGGTGKTPLVRWLVGQLSRRGFRPGIVLRGHGGRDRGPRRVLPGDPVEAVGDEALMLAEGTDVPVYAGRDRRAAVARLVAEGSVDLVVADDGLQHYALPRDLEIAVVDGSRALGNGRLLPAGPLREGPQRLTQVDWVCVVGGDGEGNPPGTPFRYQPTAFRPLDGSAGGAALSPQDFAARHSRVQALTGIGNPGRFAATLAELGMDVELYACADHHRFVAGDLALDPQLPVVCTEKDAVKLRALLPAAVDVWVLAVRLEPGVPVDEELDALLAARQIQPRYAVPGERP